MFSGNHYLGRKKRPKGRNKSERRRRPVLSDTVDRLMLALEPRLLFDAAGLIAGVELISQPESTVFTGDSGDTFFDASSDALPDGNNDGLMSVLDFLADPLPPAAQSPAAIAFVDASVAEPEKLVGGVAPDTLVVTLSPDADGVTQIGDVLARYSNIQAVHIISHGDAGRIVLGDAELSGNTIDGYAHDLQNWGASLSPGADILIYGCNVADGIAGQAFVAQLADMTGADVAASNDPTGAVDLGGDWHLEVNRGPIDNDIAISSAAQSAYNGLLDIKVANANDSGAGSLRDALKTAVDGENIYFDAGLAGQTIKLATPLYFYSSAIIDNDGITGAEDGIADVNVTISGTNSTTALVNLGYNAAIDGLTIQDGYSFFAGGGIANFGGTLTINDSTISNNYSAFLGGGIYNGYYGAVNIYNSTISKNATLFSGGGIENEGALYVSGSTISYNNAINGAGGGIDNYSYLFLGPATATVYNSTISGNNAYYGGGITNSVKSTLVVNTSKTVYNTSYAGGGIDNAGTLTVSGSTISNNTASYNGVVGGVGGGIDNVSGTATVYSSTISNNNADFYGGGIYNRKGTVTVDGSTISSNKAAIYSGGGVWNSGTLTVQNGSTINGNFAYSGGGISNDGGSADLDSSNVYGNYALKSGGGIWNNATLNVQSGSQVYNNYAFKGRGGGIYNNGGTTAVNYSQIYNNYAYSGGGIWNNATLNVQNKSLVLFNYAYSGGGINNYGGTATVDYATLGFNKALNSGGGIWNNATLNVSNSYFYINIAYSGSGGGIDNNGGTVTVDKSGFIYNMAYKGSGGGISNYGGSATVDNSYLVYNKAYKSGGGIWNSGTLNVQNGSAVYGNYAYQGSGIYNYGGSATVDNSYLVYNKAYKSGGGIWSNKTLNVQNSSAIYGNYAYYGGGISNYGGNAIVDNSAVVYNKAGVAGGGIWNSGTLNVRNGSSIYDNYAFKDSGGGIHNFGGVATVDKSSISNNFAYYFGAGISNIFGTIYVNSSQVNSNYAGYSAFVEGAGAGIFNANGTATITSSTISKNVVLYGSGGGIVNDSGTVTVTGSTISDNYAEDRAGGILNLKGTADVTNSTISNNVAYLDGGGIDNLYGKASISESTLSYNISLKGSGGGIFNDYGTVDISNSTLSSNQADYYGGGVYNNDKSNVYLYHSTIANNTALKAGSGIYNRLVAGTTIGHTIVADTVAPGAAGIISKGYNLFAQGAVLGSVPADILAGNADLQPLANNGGPTQTHRPGAASDALEAGDPLAVAGAGGVPADDQRGAGFGRVGGVIDIGAVENQHPTAVDDGFSTDEDTAITTTSVLVNDTDPESSSLTVSAFDTTGTKGVVSDNGNGTFDYNPNGQFEFLGVGDTAADTFTYTVSDGFGGTDTATVTITVTGVNDDPVANDDKNATNEDTKILAAGTTDVRVNDTDPEGDPLTMTAYTKISAMGAAIVVYANGTYDYDPTGAASIQALAAGESAVDTFMYKISDGNGGEGTGTVHITVTGVNDPVTAVDDGGAGFGTDENTAFTTGSVLINDTDPDTSDTLLVIGHDATATKGKVTDNGDGTFDYDPDGKFGFLAPGATATDTFTYTVDDGNGSMDLATVTITITGANDPPVANDDAYTIDEDTAFTTGNVLVNDTDPNPTDKLSVTGLNTTGTKGLVTDNGDGTFDYNPNGQFESLGVGDKATDTFMYTVSDGKGGSDTAQVTITVTGVNDSPTAIDDGFGTDEDTAITTGSVLVNDTDPDATDKLSVTKMDTTGTKGLVIDNGDGTFDYDPNGQFESLGVGDKATDTFMYTVSDGNGGSDTAQVTITVTGVNDPPVAVNDGGVGFVSNQDTAFTTGNVLPNDTDPDAGDILSVTAIDTTGTKGLVTDNGDGTFDYDPNGQFSNLLPGSVVGDTFTYTVSDGNGGTDTATVLITIRGINQAPVAVDDSGVGFITDEDTTITTGNVLDNDFDPDFHPLSVVTLDTTETKGEVKDNGDGTFSYDPNGQFESLADGETATDTFTYTVSDSLGSTDTATVTITISGVDDGPISPDAPTAVDDGYRTDEDTAITTGNVLANDTDPDSDPLSVAGLNTTGTRGVVTNNGDGTFNYDPRGPFDYLAVGETATDTFTYTVSDGNGGTDTAQVTITISGVNDTPEAKEDYEGTEEHKAITTGNVLANDVDPDASDILSISGLDTSETKGEVKDNGDGTFEYDPNGQFNFLAVGENVIDTFTYTVSDGNGGTDKGVVSVTVTGAGAPTGGWERDLLPPDEGKENPQSGGSGQRLLPPGERVMDGLFGQRHYNSRLLEVKAGSGGWQGWDDFYPQDPGKGENEAPQANADKFSIRADLSFTTGNVLANDVDPNPGDKLSVIGIDTKGTKGRVTNNGDGTFGYDPNGQFDFLAAREKATDTFSYTVSDGNGGTDTATVTIIVIGTDNGDVSVLDDSVRADEDFDEVSPVATGFNEQLKTASGQFESERLAFLNKLSSQGPQAA